MNACSVRRQIFSRWERQEGKDCVTTLQGRRIVAYCWRSDKQIESVHLRGVGLKSAPRQLNDPSQSSARMSDWRIILTQFSPHCPRACNTATEIRWLSCSRDQTSSLCNGGDKTSQPHPSSLGRPPSPLHFSSSEFA